MENPVVSIPGCVWQIWKRIKMHAGVWYGTLKQTDSLEDPVTDGRIILNEC
jgi:hypothetical protein